MKATECVQDPALIYASEDVALNSEEALCHPVTRPRWRKRFHSLDRCALPLFVKSQCKPSIRLSTKRAAALVPSVRTLVSLANRMLADQPDPETTAL